MCRWFAYISKDQEILLEDALVVPEHALSKQVHERFLPYLIEHEPGKTPEDTKKEIALRNRFFNADGLGLAWCAFFSQSSFVSVEFLHCCPGCRYDNTRERFRQAGGRRPTVYKIVRQPLTDPNFTSICENTASTAIFAHIRAASPGTAITAWNAHPFPFGRYTFMHNGDLAYWDKIKLPICQRMSSEAYNKVLGSTDSEHFAGLMFTFLAEITMDKKPAPKVAAPISDARSGASDGPETGGDAPKVDPEDVDLLDLIDAKLGQLSELGDLFIDGLQLREFSEDTLDQLIVGAQRLIDMDSLTVGKDAKKVKEIKAEEIDLRLPVWERRHDLEDIRKAVEMTIKQIIVYQVEAAKEKNKGLPIELQTLDASNINIVVSDGYQLLAIRCRNHVTQYPPSLYVSRTAGPSLNRAFVGNPNDDTVFNPYMLNFTEVQPTDAYKSHFIICSEPTTFREADWKLVDKNTGVMVDENMKETWFDVDMGLN